MSQSRMNLQPVINLFSSVNIVVDYPTMLLYEFALCIWNIEALSPEDVVEPAAAVALRSSEAGLPF